jgi:hypothetical protein
MSSRSRLCSSWLAVARVCLYVSTLECAAAATSRIVASPQFIGDQIFPTPVPFFITHAPNAPVGESIRYQQVIGSVDFEVYGVHQCLITELRFFAGSVWSDSVTVSNVQVNLSTTQSAPGGLNVAFGANVGADDTRVFLGPLTVSRQDSCDGLCIPLNPPFPYNAKAGNLLMDVRNFQSIPGEEIETPHGVVFNWNVQASDSRGDVSCALADDATAVTATFHENSGVWIRFSVIPAPALRTRLSDGGAILISWPAEFTDWTLEEGSHLGATNWTPVTLPRASDGTNLSVTIIPQAGGRFFRLLTP